MILITGASSGIGKACAKVFAEQKKNLFLVARRLERLEALKAELEAEHKIRVEIAPLDVSDRTAVAAFGAKYASLLDEVEVLVNNAGLAKGREPIQNGKPEDWDVMIDTNIKGLLYITHEVLPHFLKKKSGHIVNIGSVAGYWTYTNGNVYCATKFAVAALTQSLRVDLHGSGIRVSEIAPGMVETEFSMVRFGDAEKAKAVYQGVEPLTPRDIAETVAWVATRPQRVNIQQVILYTTDQASPNQVFRRP